MLNGQVLVLNRSWVVVNVTSVKRALLLLFQGHARVVHPHDYTLYEFEDWCALSRFGADFASGRYIHTPTTRIRLPEVILLSAFNGFIRREVRLSRRNIFERDEHKCQYCNRRFPKSDLTIDHVLPHRVAAGTPGESVLACVKCNVTRATARRRRRMPCSSAPRRNGSRDLAARRPGGADELAALWTSPTGTPRSANSASAFTRIGPLVGWARGPRAPKPKKPCGTGSDDPPARAQSGPTLAADSAGSPCSTPPTRAGAQPPTRREFPRARRPSSRP